MKNWRALLHSPPPTTCWVVDGALVSVLRRDKKGSVLWAAEGAPPGLFDVGPVGLQSVDRRKLSAVLSSLQPRIEGASRAALVMPSGWTRSYLLDFDDLPRSQAELDQVVRWRLKKLLPVQPSELRLSVEPVSRSNGKHSVLCMAAMDRALTGLEAAYSDVGVELGMITTRAFALTHRSVQSPHVIIQQEDGFLMVLLVADGWLRLIRTKPLSSARNSGEVIRRELNLTLGFIRQDLGFDGEIELRISADNRELLGEIEDWRAGAEGLPRSSWSSSPTFTQGGAGDRLGAARIEPAYAIIAEVEG